MYLALAQYLAPNTRHTQAVTSSAAHRPAAKNQWRRLKPANDDFLRRFARTLTQEDPYLRRENFKICSSATDVHPSFCEIHLDLQRQTAFYILSRRKGLVAQARH